MATPNYTRVLVHLRRATQGTNSCAQFSECILDSLGLSGEGLVECSLHENKLFLHNPAQSSVHTGDTKPLYKIMHPPFCPVHHLDEEARDKLPPETTERGVDVGVAVLLESSDHKLLLTHRAGHMRTFPSIWVPPGGHVEVGESLEDAVLRELGEETGLVVTQEERKSSHILGLWESVYPPVLSYGEPSRHHVVVYLHIILSKTSGQLNKELKLCPEEVDAAAWLSVNLIRLAVWSKDEPDDSNELIPVTFVNKDGEHWEGTVESLVLTKNPDPHALTFDRISTGSRYALSLWLSQHLKEVGGFGTSQRHLYGQFMKADTANLPQKSKF